MWSWVLPDRDRDHTGRGDRLCDHGGRRDDCRADRLGDQHGWHPDPAPTRASPMGDVAIAPNGARAYVTASDFLLDFHTVTPIDVATNTPGSPIPVGPSPMGSRSRLTARNRLRHQFAQRHRVADRPGDQHDGCSDLRRLPSKRNRDHACRRTGRSRTACRAAK